MLALENADEILQILDRFTKQKSKDIPPELEEYINYVAKTGDTVYRWPTVQYLFREKLRNVIKDFHDTTASIEDLPQCPNVDQFNYDSMKTLLFERFDCFQAAPFTIQRLCELLTDPKKHYSRLDKFMRALEKNILVVSTVEPGRKSIQSDSAEIDAFNNDVLNDINIDVEVNKNDEKQSNGKDNKHSEFNSTEHMDENVASSSSSTSSSSSSSSSSLTSPDIEMKKDESTKVEATASDKLVESDKSAENIEPQKSSEATDTPMATEPTEIKPVVDDSEQKANEKENDVIPKPDDQVKPSETTEKIEPEASVQKGSENETAASKAENVDENKSTPLDAEIEEKKNEAEIKELPPIEEIKPTTPKHARSSSDDEDDLEDHNSSAKKIRLDFDESEKKEEAKPSEPEDTSEAAAVASEVDLEKETDILESISSEIDAQKENELLEDVVDSVLVGEKAPVNIENVQPIEPDASKPIEEELPATDDLLKTDVPVAIPSDLDFTPDEALNELVSSDILAVIPEQQPVEEEVKMGEESNNVAEPVVQSTDEMNVENTEASGVEAENAMEAAPIKTDEEKMDVDESNSVDAMDL